MSGTPLPNVKRRDLHPGKLVWLVINAGLALENRESIAIPSVVVSNKDMALEAEFLTTQGLLQKIPGGYRLTGDKGYAAYSEACIQMIPYFQGKSPQSTAPQSPSSQPPA